MRPILARTTRWVSWIFTSSQVMEVVGRSHPFLPATILAPARLLCAEKTHNNGGGSIWPLEQLTAVADTAAISGWPRTSTAPGYGMRRPRQAFAEREYAAAFD